MKKTFILLLCSFFLFAANAQEKEKKVKEKTKKEKKEKTPKEKKEKSSKDKDGKKRDDADVFIGEPEGDNYQLDDRREISKPEMPSYDVEQGFNSQKKKNKQQDAYENNEYYFPAKPKNAWQLGLHGGLATLNGDINQNFFKGNKPMIPGYTFGASIRKPFSYMFSMRMNYSFLEFWNTDWQPSTLTDDQIANTRAETGNASAFAGYEFDNVKRSNFYQNSHTVGHDLTLDAVVSFGNVRFHKERSKFIFNVYVTGGAMMYRTWYDLYDDNGDPYNYDASIGNPDNEGTVSKKDVLTALNDMRNRVYETEAERPNDSDRPRVLGYSLSPVFGFGFDFQVRLARFMDLDLGPRIMFTRDDLLDGMRWQEPHRNAPASDPFASNGLTREFDSYMTFDVGLAFNLVGKKKTEPITLLNPMHYTYQKLAEANPEQAIEDLLKDDDGDGVPNRLDQEEDTPEGAPVNPKGIALDSDGDGIIDLNDEEPFSPPGLPVNGKGVAELPPNECCDLAANGGSGYNCDTDMPLPSVHFDKDKYSIKPEFYAHLHTVAEKMLNCPDMVVSATGMTDKDDNSKYNEQLSYNRVEAVVDYLNSNYGIDRNRFQMNFDGESSASGTTRSQQYEERKVTLKQVTDGSTGNGNVAPPHPGINAGSK